MNMSYERKKKSTLKELNMIRKQSASTYPTNSTHYVFKHCVSNADRREKCKLLYSVVQQYYGNECTRQVWTVLALQS
jgi:hypothetical protein